MVIGPSLSEPHTSESALRSCVYLPMLACLQLFAAIYRKFKMSKFKYFTNIDPVKHAKANRGYCQSAMVATRSKDK